MRRSTRAKLIRFGLYAILIGVAIALVFIIDWAKLQRVFLQWDIAKKQFPEIVTIAAKNTVIFTAIAFTGGLLLGLTLALMKLSSVAPYRWIATVYIEIFRGLPALLTIFATAFVLPIALGISVPYAPVGAGIVGLIVVAAAYMAETIRAGIQAVPKGQVEAARSLGMSSTRTMVSIVLPQGIRLVIPPMTNEFVLLIKDTALLFIAGSTLTTKELTTFTRGAVQTAGNGTPLLLTGILYLMITIPLTRLVAWLEKRQARAR